MTKVSVVAAVEALAGADVAAVDTAACVELLREVRRTRGWLDALEARLGSRMRELSTASAPGTATGVADVHGCVGGVSAAEGRRKDRRSKTLDEAPSFGDALASGVIGAEHVDALANATAPLDDTLRTELLDQQESLLAAAATMTPEQFARTCSERIRRLERDHGIARNQQQRRDTFLSRRLNQATGMIEGRYAFHPELGNQIFNAVDRELAAIVAAGEHAGDPEFVNRRYDRNRLTAQALGRLVACGHDRQRPLEADITYLIDARTAATGQLHQHSVCETGDGLPVPPDTIRRMLCNGRLTPVILGIDGVPINVGRTHRHATRPQRRALRAIYRTCAFHGCDTAFDRCDIHHIDYFEHGGTPTSTICCPYAPATTTSSTKAAGPSTSPPTAPSPSPAPTTNPTQPADPTSPPNTKPHPTTDNDNDNPQRDARPPATRTKPSRYGPDPHPLGVSRVRTASELHAAVTSVVCGPADTYTHPSR